MSKYIITENLEDHIGYSGETVTIINELEDNYFEVVNDKGQVWTVGEEEIKEV